MLDVSHLKKRFGPIHAVADISFRVDVGEVLGFLGPNGAGKTTTMRMIAGFLRPDSGTVTIAGHSMIKEPVAAKDRLGYLPENAPAYDDMTVKAFLRFIAEMRGMPRRDRSGAVEQAIARCRLDAVRHRPTLRRLCG